MSDVHFEFDENFKKVLEHSGLQEKFVYRNCLIDELTARGEMGRGEMSSRAKTRREELFYQKVERVYSIGFVLASIALMIFVISLWPTIRGGPIVEQLALAGLVVVLAYLTLSSSTRELSCLWRRNKTDDDAEGAEKDFSSEEVHHILTADRIAKSLKKDTTMVLWAKKEAIDEKLGL